MIYYREYHEIYPKFPVNDATNSVEFTIGGPHDPHFMYPDSLELFGSWEVGKQDGTDFTEEDGKVSACNLFPMAIWENLAVFLNGTQIRF